MSYGWGWGQGRGQGRGRGMGYGRVGYGRGLGSADIESFPVISPPSAGGLRVAASVDENAGVQSRISPRFARSLYIAVVDISDGKVVNVNIVPNPARNAMGGAGMMVAQWLISSGVKIVIGPAFGPNASGVLSRAGVEVYTIQPGTPLIDALRQLGLVKE